VAKFSDLDIKYTTVPLRLDKGVNGASLPDFYLYVRNGITFPERFDSRDKWLATQLLMWGECEERPRKRVINFISELT
jgi:hypothetical protein